MKHIDEHKFRETMIKAVTATRIVKEQSNKGDSWSKKDNTPVTIADLASQAILLGEIATISPESYIYAEESMESLNDDNKIARIREVIEAALNKSLSIQEVKERISYRGKKNSDTSWFVDPVDGTKGYIKDLVYAIAVCKSNKGELEESWMAVPGNEECLSGVVGSMYYARKNLGTHVCELNDCEQMQKLPILPVDHPGKLVVVGSRAHGGSSLPPPMQKAGIEADNLPLDSQAKYAALVRGKAQVYVRKHSHSFGANLAWDHGAGVLIVQECGGIVSDLDGKNLDFTQGSRLSANNGVLATSNQKIYDQLLPVFRDFEE